MKLTEIIREDLILPQLCAHDRLEAIEELASFLAERHPGVSAAEAARALAERERLGSTAVGEQLAIPHAKFDSPKELIACLGRSRKGIDFGSANGKPTHFFFVLIAPTSAPGVHLKALAQISRLFKDVAFRDRLKAAKTAREMYEVIAQADAG